MWQIEVTDTCGGQANYSWVQRYSLERDYQSRRALVRAIKRITGFNGVRTAKPELFGSDEVWIRLRGLNIVIVAYWQDPA